MEPAETKERVPDWWLPFLDQIQYPAWWHAYRGPNNLYFAHRINSSPPKIVRAETPLLLRDEVRREDSLYDRLRGGPKVNG